ncbi:hypothetical protein J4434_03935 [Candidatus Woesearchaeota archaeon]|nr:hypothetical protein [Candidatus Woesearchaeota archaeon]
MSKKDELLGEVLKRAKKSKKKPTLVLCEGWDDRGLRAAEFVVKEGIANIIILDIGNKVSGTGKKQGINTSLFEVIDIKDTKNPRTTRLKEELAEALFKAREKKGMNKEAAKILIEDENYFGCMMALTGKVDGVLGSLMRPTGDLMKPALQLLKKSFVNEVSVAYDPRKDRILFMSDGSLNISPTPEQLGEMAVNTAEVAKMFDYEPKVGMLSFSTKGSGGDTPETFAVREAIKKAEELAETQNQTLEIGGEYQFDAAVNPDAAKRKCPDDKLAGQINCVIFPNLTAANIFVHGMGQFSDMEFLFTVMCGMLKPVTILGRSMPYESVKSMFIVTAVEASENKN